MHCIVMGRNLMNYFHFTEEVGAEKEELSGLDLEGQEGEGELAEDVEGEEDELGSEQPHLVSTLS